MTPKRILKLNYTLEPLTFSRAVHLIRAIGTVWVTITALAHEDTAIDVTRELGGFALCKLKDRLIFAL